MAGNQNSGATKGETRIFRDMLNLAINDAKGERVKLRKICEQLVAKAIDGDMAAIKEVADRLDGKAPQAVVGDTGGAVRHEITLNFVE